MRRGDLVVVALRGDFGKPRPALVISSDAFLNHPLVTVCPLTATLKAEPSLLRVTIQPTVQNGLKETSQIAVNRMTGTPRGKVGAVIGRADQRTMVEVNRALAV